MTFADLGLIPPLLQVLEELGYSEPTPIQSDAIPLVLANKDLLASAQTGTGKTASFALPILQALATHGNKSTSPARHPIRALILLPTRELAVQVYNSFKDYARHLPLKIGCVYGGVDMNAQVIMLRQGVEILVATPGRFLDHVEQKNIFLSHLTHFVLDEADRMLDMGFLPDISKIMGLLPKKRQTLLFSATFSKEIRKLADSLLNHPSLIEVAQANSIADTITHHVFLVNVQSKPQKLVQWINQNAVTQALIFVETKIGCEKLSRYLKMASIPVAAIHGDKDQNERLAALDAFRKGEIGILVATDVAARGLDIDNMPHVINYSLPNTPEDYIHRIGRTGRRGNQGSALSFVSPEEEKKLEEIEKLIGHSINHLNLAPEQPETNLSRASQNKSKFKCNLAKSYLSSLDFDVHQPFKCAKKDFTKTKRTSKVTPQPNKPISALLGGKK